MITAETLNFTTKSDPARPKSDDPKSFGGPPRTSGRALRYKSVRAPDLRTSGFPLRSLAGMGLLKSC
ncbi:hypothetical protein D4L85_01595 [Chryseolinea soli]|uniref:Uncharacterized protein n=1 Tax=Chryseolinea soli TaxID=2321403 RepID=A0A385SG21_9BACT|nr:hypothetical protein D4L85_01595 [Chryseolinea soli]